MSKVAIIMPVHNCQAFVKQSIESVLDQTFKDWSLYIFDDGSTDKSLKIIKKYADGEQIKFFENVGKERKRPAESRNILIKHALKDDPKTKYIAIQDADDIAKDIRLETEVNFLEQNDDHVLVGSDYDVIDSQGKVLQKVTVKHSDEEIRTDLYNQNWFGHGSVMMYAPAFVKVGGYDPIFKWCHDYEMLGRLLRIHTYYSGARKPKRWKVANIPEVLYAYRRNPQGLEVQKQKNPAKKAYYIGLMRYKANQEQVGSEFKEENYRQR